MIEIKCICTEINCCTIAISMNIFIFKISKLVKTLQLVLQKESGLHWFALLLAVLTRFARLNECCKKAQFPAKYLNDGFMLDSLWTVCPIVKQSRNLQHISLLRWWLDQSKATVNQKDKSTEIGSLFVCGVRGLELNLGNKVEQKYPKMK